MAMEEGRQLNALFDTILEQRQALAPYQHIEITPLSRESQPKHSIDGRNHLMDEKDWKEVISTSLSRGVGDCAICMCANHSIVHRSLTLLSCSHIFHHQCILNLEKFCGSNDNDKSSAKMTCPVCRSHYQRRNIDQHTIRTFTK